MADVLVTGGTGYLGGPLVRALCGRGERVRVLLRTHSPRTGLAGLEVEEALGDLTDAASVARALQGVREVFHLAAAVRLDPFAEEKLRRVNVEGTRTVARAAREAGVRRLIHVSSSAAVGQGTLERPSGEEHPFDAGELGPYFRTKRAAEEVVREAVALGLDAVIVNPSNIVGPGGVPGALEPLLALVKRGLPFYPPGSAAFVSVGDVVQGCLLARERGRAGERYILSSENVSQRAFLALAAELARARPPRFRLPRGPALGLAKLGDLLGPRFPRAFAMFNSTTVGLLFRDFCVSSEKAQRELGWRPQPIRAALADELAAMARDRSQTA
ncbi:MAG: NAD-dependent epimerase/dehydratase family protein [Deltaproteobacteria bacterium]